MSAGSPRGFHVHGAVVEVNGREVVRGLDLHLTPGDVVAMAAPSSIDTSSVLAALAGQRPLAGGTRTLDGGP
ncbi:hypothetical protein [uncultured Friedmanniella sp.]|uniref:hypothetical protein n=1 Tax=uncultured Friedmanniella sp. TaxID=335381 RepID=UPI0035CCA5B5